MADPKDITAGRASGDWARTGYALAMFLSAACELVLEIVAAPRESVGRARETAPGVVLGSDQFFRDLVADELANVRGR